MAERTTWEQPPSAVRRSEAPLFLHATIVELRSTGQPGRLSPRGFGVAVSSVNGPFWDTGMRGKVIFCGLSRVPCEEIRIKCG